MLCKESEKTYLNLIKNILDLELSGWPILNNATESNNNYTGIINFTSYTANMIRLSHFPLFELQPAFNKLKYSFELTLSPPKSLKRLSSIFSDKKNQKIYKEYIRSVIVFLDDFEDDNNNENYFNTQLNELIKLESKLESVIKYFFPIIFCY